MIKTKVKASVSQAADHIKESLKEKGFTLFCDIDHQANAAKVDLTMPASRVLIFGNPMAGTALMNKDITMSLDLPLRIALVDDNGETLAIHQSTDDYIANYHVKDHPVLEKVENLFKALISSL